MERKELEQIAISYKETDKEIKSLSRKLKNYKKLLLDYANDNPDLFDENFQLKFLNGLFISQRVKQVLSGSNDNKLMLLDAIDDEYITESLNDELIIKDAPNDKLLMKLLTKFNVEIKQKEILAIHAGIDNK